MNQQVLGITMGDRLSFARILKLGLGGAVGGLLTFIIFNPFVRGMALLGDADFEQGWVTTGIALGAVVGLTIGGCLIASEEWHTRSIKRIAAKSLLGALAGTLCGALGGLDGQYTFHIIGSFSVVLGRCMGWALMGAGAGICPGLVAMSYKRSNLGAIGGLVGGATGGILFDLMAWITRSADLSRALGLMLVGAAIGIAVGLIEEIAKEYWLTILTGSKEGQSIPLSKDETRIGKDETVEIPLFGDGTVQKFHATIVKSESGAYIRAEQPGSPVFINSQPTTSAVLSNGDIISIGKHRIRFGARGSSGFAAIVRSGQYSTPAPPQQYSAPTQATAIMIVAGPHAGTMFPLTSASMSIGRSPECNIPLPNDTRISRQHARLVWNGSSWRVEDCASTNGLFVNNQLVSAQAVQPGDQVTVGESTLRVQ